MRRISKLFNFSLFWLFLAWCLPLDGFDMRIFKVGQANFVLLTHRERALVVDCGVGDGYGGCLKRGGERAAEICTALENVVTLGIVITHDHVDHHNNVSNLIKIINSINGLRAENERTVIEVGKTCNGWEVSKAGVEAYVNHFFGGDGVEITCIRPENFVEAFLNPETKHENNLLLLLYYQGVSILLPGDANGSLLAHHLLHTAWFKRMLQGVNVFLASHHGSTANGEHVWLDAIFQEVDAVSQKVDAIYENGTRKLRFLFVSSDPSQSDELPRQWFWDKVHELPPMNYIGLTSEAKAVCYRLSVESWCLGNIFDGQRLIFLLE